MDEWRGTRNNSLQVPSTFGGDIKLATIGSWRTWANSGAAQKFQRAFHVDRNRGGEFHFLTRAWVGEGEFVGMKQNARRFITGEFCKLLGLALAVGIIAGNGKTQMLEVNSDLVGAAGVQFGFDEGGLV